jgi:surface carbohydrate biosynthesis protein
MIRDDVPTILFPVEKPGRELDSKLVVASASAARGCRAIVSQISEASFIGDNSYPLVWQGQNVISHHKPHSSNRQTADRLLSNGSAIMYLHDEGGMFEANSWKEQVIGKHQLEALRSRTINRICAWGRKQRDVMSEYAPEMADRLRVTGSPRFDICSSRFDWIARNEVQEIRDKFGPFILACTRFGSIASKKGIHHPFERKLDPHMWPANLETSQVADLWFTKWRQDVHDFTEFVVLMKELATAHPDRQIVLRPHPSEELLFYGRALTQFKNVKVINEGNVMNWIRAADLLVHSNCTTGIEATLSGRPVLNFVPGDEDRANFDVEVAREAGATARSLPEAMEMVEALLSGARPVHTWSRHAASILNNLESDAIPILVDETLSVIRERGIGGSRVTLPLSRSGYGVGGFLKKMFGRQRQKTGKLNLEHIEMILEGCGANGIGAGQIREFTPYYVVIDPT